MLLLHLSDLHLTRYGENRKWRLSEDGDDWEKLNSWRGWLIEGCRDRKDRPEKLRLRDPEGLVHGYRKWPTRKEDKAVGSLLNVAMKRHSTAAPTLVAARPGADDLASLLRVSPNNTNLRFLELLDQVLPLNPDLILITGDLTDNGFGYDLVEHFLKPWIDRKRLFVVPGNHDTYDMFPGRGRKLRVRTKWDSYRAFAEQIHNGADPCGAYFRMVNDIAIVGLSSCKPPLTLLSASGEVNKDQLEWLFEIAERRDFKKARHRLALVHHHLLRMPYETGKGTPMEMGLRLRNAKDVMRTCVEAGIDIIFNGHKHHGYSVQLPEHPMIVSSPSSTYGCKSTDSRYVWLLDLAEGHPAARYHRYSEERASFADEDDGDDLE